MIFVSHYDSPLGILYLAADKDGLKGEMCIRDRFQSFGFSESLVMA